jgi:hypothetical protein
LGEHCEQLDLLPLDRSALVSNSSGLNELASSSTSTWGGAAVPQRQQWHMVYSEMQNKCGINSWLSNSAVRHAISRSPLGPFQPQSELVFPVFSHEPTLASAPSGETAMFFTHRDHPATFAGTCNCTDGNSSASCPPDWDRKRGRDPAAKLLTFLSITHDFQRWSNPVPVLPQADPYSDTAFSATILDNGTLVAMTRTQVLVGDDWRNVSTYRQVHQFKANHYGEGADMWHDPSTGAFHMLSHDGNQLGTTCGKHYWAPASDLTTWRTHGCAYQAKGVAMADGGKVSFGRRERPHIFWAPPPPPASVSASALGAGAVAPVPMALSTAVTAVPTACIGKPCLWRFPDASFTLLQGLRQHASTLTGQSRDGLVRRSHRASKHDDLVAPIATLPTSILQQRRYGVNIEGAASFADERQMSNESWARLALAFSTVRVDITWQLVEQAQGIYNFSVYDRLFARCAEVGVLPYIILDYDNRLYGRCPEGHCLCTANAVAAFVKYAVAVVQRFSHAMAFELWNEPNLHGARPHNMPVSAYSDLLTAVGGALKNSTAHAVLVAGATAGVDAYFIGALSKSGALQYADAVSVHPYAGACGGPELYDDPSTWQHGLVERLHGETDLPIIWSELGWSTCSDPHKHSVSATCASFPGSQDTLDDQAIFLARQWLLGALNATPALFVFEWANGDGLPDGHHNTGAAHNASNGGDNFGLNWGLDGPPKPAYTAAAHFQAAVGRRDFIGRIQPTPPPQMHLDDERRWEGGGSGDANLTYILAFAAQRPVGSFATVAPQPLGTPAEAYAVYSLQMTGAVAQQTGAGNRTACPGFLARVQLPTAAACEAACRSAPRCRSFVFWPNATGNVSCSLCGSRCLSPGVVSTGNCSGGGGPGGCIGAQAFTLRQSAKQNVTFSVPASGALCYAVTDVNGAAGVPATVCAGGGEAAHGRLLTVGATDAPIYLTAVKSEEWLVL